jgi:hypothetical protein
VVAGAVDLLVDALHGDDPQRSFRAAGIAIERVLRPDSQIS